MLSHYRLHSFARRLMYRILFGVEGKNTNPRFDMWRALIMERRLEDESTEVAARAREYLQANIENHWVLKPMGGHYRALVTAYRLGFTQLLVESVLSSHDSLLDVGCASGLLLANLPNNDVTGVDRHLECVQAARARGIAACVADAHHLPFRDECFDWVLLLETLEHVSSPLTVLSECRRVCRKGMIASVPYYPASRVSPPSLGAFKEDCHVFELNPEDLCSLCEHASLRIIDQSVLDIKEDCVNGFANRLLSYIVGQHWPKWCFVVARKSGAWM